MSEYQYYEFQAIDRPLSKGDMGVLRALSTRAEITPTSFTNFYNFGGFKGNPATLVEKYFDAFLYLANWGTHELMLRLPKRLLDPKVAGRYCAGESASARTKGDSVILEFRSEEEGAEWESDGPGLLSSIIPVRGEIAGGDLRALYLGWLLCAQEGAIEEDDVEPEVPAGLQSLSASLTAFAEFLRIDSDLIAVAAEASRGDRVPHATSRDLADWIAGLPVADKDALLLRAAQEGAPHLQMELQRRFLEARVPRSKHDAREEQAPRSAAQLLAAAESRREERARRQAAKAAQERARREREEAAARERYLKDLAKREATVWREVEALIATKRPADYDRAVQLLVDLRDIGVQAGRAAEVRSRIEQIRAEHSRKPSLLQRLAQAGLNESIP